MNSDRVLLLKIKSALDGAGFEKAKAAGSELQTKLGGAGKAAGMALASGLAAGAAIGATAIIGIGAAWVGAQGQQEQAINQLQADLGVTRQEAEALGDVGLEVFKNNWADSIGEANAAVGQAKRLFGELRDDELAGVTQQAFAMRDAFGIEVEASFAAAQRMAGAFGITVDEAMDLLARGVQTTGEEGQEMALLFQEYSGHLAQLKIDGPSALSAIESGLEAGAFEGDKVLDMFKEMNIKMTEGSDATKEALGRLGLDPSIIESYRAGEISGKEMFETIQGAIQEYEGNIPADLLADTLGTPAEDLGADVVRALDLSGDAVGDFEGAAMKAGDAVNNSLGAAWANLKRSVIGGLAGTGGEGPFSGFRQQGIDALNTVSGHVDSFFSGMAASAERGGTGIFDAIASGLAAIGGEETPPVLVDISLKLRDVQDRWDEVSAAFQEGGFQGALEELTGVDLQPLIDTFNDAKDVAQELWDTYGPIFNDIQARIVDTVVPAVIDVLTTLKDSVLPALQSAGSDLADMVTGTLMPAWQDNLQPVLERFRDEILPQLQEFIDGPLVSALKTLIEGGIEGLQAAFEALMPVIEFLIPPLMSLWGWVGDKLMSAFSLFLDVASPILDFLAEHKTLLLAVAAVIATVATGGIPAIILAIAALGLAFDDIKKWLSGLRDDWQQKWDEVQKKIDDIDLRQIGEDIIDGLKEGLSNAWGRVTSWASDKMAELQDTFSLPWEFGSPSKLMKRWGTWIMVGLALGIQIGGATAAEAMESSLTELERLRAEADQLRTEFFEMTGGREFDEVMSDIEDDLVAARKEFDEAKRELQASAAGGPVDQAAMLELQEAFDARKADLEEWRAQVTEAHDVWQDKIDEVEQAYRRAQAAIKAAQEAAEEEERQIHAGVMQRLEEHRDAREQFWADEMARAQQAHDAAIAHLDAEQQKWEDHIAAQEEALDDMKLDLEGLILDLDLPAQTELIDAANAKLDAMQTRLEHIRSVAESLEVVGTGRDVLDQMRAAQTERVRAVTEDQRTLLQDALGSGLLNEEQARTAELLLLGYKAKATDVAEIFDIMAHSQEQQVQAQQKVLTQEERRLAAMEDLIAERQKEIAQAEHALNLEKDRVEEILDGIDRRRQAEIDRFNDEKARIAQERQLELDAIDAAIQREEDRHAARTEQIEAEFTYQMLLLDHSVEEIEAMLARARQETERIRQEAQAEADRAMQALNSPFEAVRDTSFETAATWTEMATTTAPAIVSASVQTRDAWVETADAAGRWSTAVIAGSSELSKSIDRLEQWEQKQARDTRPAGPSFRDMNISGKRGSGGFRAAGGDWRRWHFGEAPGPGADSPGIAPVEGAGPIQIDQGVINSVEMGDVVIEGTTVIVRVGDREFEGTVEDATVGNVRWVDKAGKVIGERMADRKS